MSTAAAVSDAAFAGVRLSPHLAKTKEDFLLCLGTPIARTATRPETTQMYAGREIFSGGGSERIKVYRLPQEVFSREALSSLEGKPIVGPDHPPFFLNSGNYQIYSKGHVQNIRRGERLENGEESVLADLVIYDRSLAEQIENGILREVSVAYDCKYESHRDGLQQTTIRGNHVAIVRSGRAGSEVRIQDSGVENLAHAEAGTEFSTRARAFHRKDVLTVAPAGVPARVQERLTINDSGECAMDLSEIDKKLDTIEKRLDQFLARPVRPQPKRSLADQIRAAVRDAEKKAMGAAERTRAEQLVDDRDMATGTRAERLAKASPEYAEYNARQAGAESYRDAARAAGRDLEKRFLPKSCVTDAIPVRAHQDSDWADSDNAVGRRLRGR